MSTIREVLYQHIQGVSNRKIAYSLNMSRVTVNKYVKLGKLNSLSSGISDESLTSISSQVATSLYSQGYKGISSAMHLLSFHKEEISSWLQHPNMTHTQIKRLLDEVGTSVSVSSVDRYVNKYFPKPQLSTVRLRTIAGQEGQVDFGYVGMMRDNQGRMRKAYAFVMVLSHSRYRYVEFVYSQDQMIWAQLHINAFKFFRGVPSRIILDNLKSGVIKSDLYDPLLNETYSELSRFYGFTIDPARVYAPEQKGKVERSIRIVKEQLIAGREYKDISEANIYASRWCKDEVSHRTCRSIGKRPIDVFLQEEQACLLPLPSDPFDIPLWTSCKVHKDHHFIVHGNFYSVPNKYIGQKITVRVGIKTVFSVR